MKIVWIEKKAETESFYITKAGFKTWWGKSFVASCITQKGMNSTRFAHSGKWIPISLWSCFQSFLETGQDYIKP